MQTAVAVLFSLWMSVGVAVPAAIAQTSDIAAALAAYDGPEREARLLDGARKESEVNVYTSLVVEDIAGLASAFEKKYGVKVKYWRAGSEKVVQRIVTEARASRFDFDIVETNGPELESLHRERVLLPAKSVHVADLLPQAVRPHREWVGTRLNMFVHAYNTNLVKKDELPKTYADLLDWYAIAPAIARVNGIALSKRPAHPHAAILFYDFVLGEEGQRILEKGNVVPTNRKVAHPATKMPLKFVDPALVLDESAKWEKLFADIIARRAN